jgi:DNA invertase Pin-like site-specific DNA recombinase
LPAQKSELTALAEKNNWQVLKEYTEVASGKNIKDRPAIQELINDIPELAPDYVLAVDQDRLSITDKKPNIFARLFFKSKQDNTS